MKTVVITGSSRGLGFEMAKQFRRNGFNLVISGTNAENLKTAERKLLALPGEGTVKSCQCNVSKLEEVEALFSFAQQEFGAVDIWINNAGVNQAPKHMWDLEDREIDYLISVDLKGAINGSAVAMRGMNKQGFGALYNVEGLGSNDAYQENFVMYGTTKRAVTYFTTALAKEVKLTGSPVLVGKLSPGIMITDFLTSANGKNGSQQLSEKEKKVYNILGDYPDVVAEFLVKEMIANKKSDVRISWLTNTKAFLRFMGAGFNKRDFFAEKK